MTNTVITFRTKNPSNEPRTIRVAIDNAPDLHLGDTFTLTSLGRFRNLRVDQRHWEGTPKWLHITCFVSSTTIADMLAELKPSETDGLPYNYILPNQPWY